MDTYCSRCGEPWDVLGITDDPTDFKFAKGSKSLILSCPACKNMTDDEINESLSPKQKERNELRAELADLLGDDVDGFAAMCEDFGLDF